MDHKPQGERDRKRRGAGKKNATVADVSAAVAFFSPLFPGGQRSHEPIEEFRLFFFMQLMPEIQRIGLKYSQEFDDLISKFQGCCSTCGNQIAPSLYLLP